MPTALERAKVSLRSWAARMLNDPPGNAPASWVVHYELWFVIAFVAAFVFLMAKSALRPFWFDELFTFYISRLPTIDQVFRAIPADGNPPLEYILVSLSQRLFGETELATRLPSILAFAGALLATYFFIRRRCGAVPALFGVFALGQSEKLAYGSEARPYALVLGFTGLALVSWQAATEERRTRILPLLGIAVGIAGAVASHHFGVLQVGIPLLFGEVFRLAKRRRFDFPLYGACAVGLSMLAATMPFARETRRIMLNYVQDSVNFWARPGLRSITTYHDMVNLWVLFAFLALLWLTYSAFKPGNESGKPVETIRIRGHEVSAAVGLALLVPFMICVTRITTGYYLARYAIGTAMGIAILMAFAAHCLGRNPSHGRAAACLCMIFTALAFTVPKTVSVIAQLTGSPFASLVTHQDSLLDTMKGQEPIVVANAVTYVAKWYYAAPPLRQRLHYLADLPFAVRQPDFLPEFSLVANQRVVPYKADDYRQFLSVHHEFFLYCVGEPRLEWTRKRLIGEGWTLTLIQRDGLESLSVARAPDR